MNDATHPRPHAGPTRGNVAAWVLLATLAAAVALAAHAALFPEPLGGAGVLALALGVLGVAAGAVVEGGAR